MAEICPDTLGYLIGAFYWTPNSIGIAEICPGNLGYPNRVFYWSPSGLGMSEIHPNTLGYPNGAFIGPKWTRNVCVLSWY